MSARPGPGLPRAYRTADMAPQPLSTTTTERDSECPLEALPRSVTGSRTLVIAACECVSGLPLFMRGAAGSSSLSWLPGRHSCAHADRRDGRRVEAKQAVPRVGGCPALG